MELKEPGVCRGGAAGGLSLVQREGGTHRCLAPAGMSEAKVGVEGAPQSEGRSDSVTYFLNVRRPRSTSLGGQPRRSAVKPWSPGVPSYRFSRGPESGEEEPRRSRSTEGWWEPTASRARGVMRTEHVSSQIPVLNPSPRVIESKNGAFPR